MKTRTLMIAVMVLLLAAGSALAQMMGGSGHMGGGNGSGAGLGHMGSGYGYGSGYGSGIGGVGGMISGMMGNTMAYGYLDNLTPVATPEEARTTIQGFIDLANSDLNISELWEYGSVYKAELSDTNGAKAFDLVVDKLTGAVSPEMGMAMMLNAELRRESLPDDFFRNKSYPHLSTGDGYRPNVCGQERFGICPRHSGDLPRLL